MLKIGITGTGSLVGQAVIKCIKASAYFNNSTIIGFDYMDNTVGSYWVNKNYRLPDILDAKNNSFEKIVIEVIRIINDEGIKILFIGIDFDLMMYALYRKKIEEATGAIVIVSSPEVVAIADNKYETFKFLKEHGFSYPETYSLVQMPGDLNFPMILKPSTGASSKGVSVVYSYDEIKERSKDLINPIIQELVGDSLSEYTCGIIMLDDIFIDSIVLRRELKNGDTYRAFYSHDFSPAIYDYIKYVSLDLKPFGVCNYQLRIDKNGVPKIFEINARHSGTTFFRQLFGYNEIEIILNNFFPVTGYKRSDLVEGTAIRYFEEKLIIKK